ncbi:MAG: urea carboxylase-associated family protein [Gammaproteobacteria bacterium]|nr:urea carboxylase-associated family protein [Gammaproteobacteria bacterium]
MDRYVVPAREGRGMHVHAGQHIRITTPHGRQAADFFAFCGDNLQEWLSPMHTWVWSRSVRPRQGDTFLSRFRRPLLDFDEDGANGVHDMLIAACDQARYEQFGFEGHHPSCSENLQIAMHGLGFDLDVVPQPVNFFTHTQVQADGMLVSPPNPVPAQAYVELKARLDLFCVVSSCPFDLQVPGWTINAAGGPTELIVEVGESNALAP